MGRLGRLRRRPTDAFAGVRLALTGAAKLPEEAVNRMRERFGVTVCEGYGLTEAGPTVTTSSGLEVRQGSIGKVLQGIEVRLVDDAGVDVLDGDPGEVWVQGPNVFAGYWHDAEATAARPDRRSAGCAPATSPSPTTRATSTSSTGPRT